MHRWLSMNLNVRIAVSFNERIRVMRKTLTGWEKWNWLKKEDQKSPELPRKAVRTKNWGNSFNLKFSPFVIYGSILLPIWNKKKLVQYLVSVWVIYCIRCLETQWIISSVLQIKASVCENNERLSDGRAARWQQIFDCTSQTHFSLRVKSLVQSF